MASGLKVWWPFSIVLLVSNLQHWAYGSIPQVPCYFVFGDSLFDNGNNNYLSESAPKANYLPYGIDYPAGSSGRCSNGLNIADVIADQLGFENYIPDFGMGSCNNILDGINYASAGAGVLNETGCVSGELFTMDIQLYYHKIVTSRIATILGSADIAQKYLSQCIYAVDMGHNDYLNNYFSPQNYNTSKIYTPEQYAELLIRTYEKQLTELYNDGARKIAVFGLIRIGCMPSNIQKYEVDKSLCAYKLNDAVQIFNKKLQKLLPELNAKLTGAKFTYINSYEIEDLANEGFKYTNKSCCEVIESGAVPCKTLSFPCANRSEYVYWDGAHFTEAKAWAFGKIAYKRKSPRNAYPYDISELVQLKLDDYDPYNINQAQL